MEAIIYAVIPLQSDFSELLSSGEIFVFWFFFCKRKN